MLQAGGKGAKHQRHQVRFAHLAAAVHLHKEGHAVKRLAIVLVESFIRIGEPERGFRRAGTSVFDSNAGEMKMRSNKVLPLQ